MFSVLLFIGSMWLRLFYRVKVFGAENIPAHGSAVLCANHVCYKDLIVLGSSIKRKARWLAKAELFKNPIIGWILTKLGGFPVKRGGNDKGAVKTVYDLLSKGEIVGIFPEGTRVKDKANRPKEKRGFVSFAVKAKVPIIPVSLVYGKGPFKRAMLFSNIKVVIHEPFFPNFEKKYSNVELMAVAVEIMNIIYSE